MCNGFSTRTSLGGAGADWFPLLSFPPGLVLGCCRGSFFLTVANLRPTGGTGFAGCQLHFRNPVPSSLPTELSSTLALPDCEIRIQSVASPVLLRPPRLTRADSNLGDLTGGVETAGKVLFSVVLVVAKAEGLALDRRLDLDVGGDGIIGRSVSVVRKGVVLGEGIVGWN